jgi:hypothetical protein
MDARVKPAHDKLGGAAAAMFAGGGRCGLPDLRIYFAQTETSPAAI